MPTINEKVFFCILQIENAYPSCCVHKFDISKPALPGLFMSFWSNGISNNSIIVYKLYFPQITRKEFQDWWEIAPIWFPECDFLRN